MRAEREVPASERRDEPGAITGPARVFEDEQSALKAILDGAIKAGDVMVLRYLGPRGAPGMPEMLAPTSALIGAGLGYANAAWVLVAVTLSALVAYRVAIPRRAKEATP